MKDASYQVSFEDLPKIQRSYSSRSLHIGYFGFGWCSNLEKSLVIKGPREINLLECNVESPYVLMDENNLLRTRTFENPITKERLIFRSGNYYLTLSNGEIRTFNKRGQNIEVRFSSGLRYEFEYRGDRLNKIKSNNGLTLLILMNDSGQIFRMGGPSNQEIIYLYEKSNLVQAVSLDRESHLFEYDRFNNLINLTYPDKSQENVVYNNEQDRVLKVELPSTCIEYYDFYTANKDPLHQVSTLTRKCANIPTEQFTYEFWYKTRDDGKKYLERYKINQPKQTLDITYHPFDGSPVKVIKNGKNLISKI